MKYKHYLKAREEAIGLIKKLQQEISYSQDWMKHILNPLFDK
jgi:hypothetical protein